MQVDILTAEQELFSGNAKGVKLPGTQGSFEILQDHAPMISSLQKGNVRVTTEEDTHHFPIQRGFVEVIDNQVSVMIEAASDKQESDKSSSAHNS